MEKMKRVLHAICDNAWGFSICSNFLSLLIGVLAFRPFFEEGDDLGIAMIAEGAFGVRDYHVMIENPILGMLEVGLSNLISGVRWHMVLQYFFVFLASVLLTYVLAQYKNGRLFSLCLELGLIFELYVSTQYVKTATFITVAALIILLRIIKDSLLDGNGLDDVTEDEKERVFLSRRIKIVFSVISYVMLVYSSLLRSKAYMMGILFSALIAAIDYFICEKNVDFLRRTVRYLVFLAPLLVLYFTVTFAEKGIYASDPEWDYYKYYRKGAINMLDKNYESLEYDKYGESLSQLGVLENDAYMYATWQIADEINLTPEKMLEISKLSGARKVNIDFWKAFIANIYNTLFDFNPVVILTLVTVILLIFINGIKSRAFLLAIIESALYGVVLFYYQYCGRWSRRVVYASLMACYVVFVYYIVSETVQKGVLITSISTAGYICLGLAFASLTAVRLGNEFEYQEYQRSETNFPVLQMYMEEESDKLFVADTFTVGGWYKYDVFAPMKVGSLKNFVTTGGWSTGSPIDHGIVEKYGYYDPFDALARGDGDVILIDNHCPDRKAIYLSDHGEGPRLAAEYIETVCGYNLYQIK